MRTARVSQAFVGAVLGAIVPLGPLTAQPVLPLTDTEQVAPAMPPVLPLRERAKVIDRLLKERLETVIPAIMREQGVEDPVIEACRTSIDTQASQLEAL